MWIKTCSLVVMACATTCLTFAWPMQSEWHGLDYARDSHSIALTAIGVGLMFAFNAIYRLGKEVAELRCRELAAQQGAAADDRPQAGDRG